MEFWNIYDKDRQLTQKQAKRKEKMQKDCYHLLAHVCLFNTKGEMLIQKRADHKKIWPGLWDVSAGGSVKLNETSRMGVQRELYEELGLSLDFSLDQPCLTLHLKEAYDDFFIKIIDIDLSTLVLDTKEVSQVKWASKEEILTLISNHQFVDYGILSALFHLKDQRGPNR